MATIPTGCGRPACFHDHSRANPPANTAAKAAVTVDAVVNNAGIIVSGPVEGLSIEDLSRQLDVNVVPQIAVTQAVLPAIRAAHGR
ncbi:MAG: SDR family NAD(P)-dependent oxidoreductase, partial [Comamonadaceae bacterium]